ncbi:MAG: hypothetical protein BWZ10_03327 [candidate division BRC1 bacterium ADurb.BinA364]|nr:MAG: hypothetical protein BWZ10_03327 [candidate division BRC1 bacterium ADurb.BinA364]
MPDSFIWRMWRSIVAGSKLSYGPLAGKCRQLPISFFSRSTDSMCLSWPLNALVVYQA